MSVWSSRGVGGPATAVLAVAGLLVLSACAGDEEPAQAPPTASPTPSPSEATETATSTAEPSPTTEPAPTTETGDSSPTTEPAETTQARPTGPPQDADHYADAYGFEFDPDPRIETVERFAIEYALAATAGDDERPEWVALLTDLGFEERLIYIGNDLGLEFPGPVPVAFLSMTEEVSEAGIVDVVNICIQAGGFALVPGTEQPASEEIVSGYDMHLLREGDDYYVHEIYFADHDCTDVEMEATTW